MQCVDACLKVDSLYLLVLVSAHERGNDLFHEMITSVSDLMAVSNLPCVCHGVVILCSVVGKAWSWQA